MARAKKSDPTVPAAPTLEGNPQTLTESVDNEPLGGGLFTLEGIRLPANFDGLSGVKKILLQIPVRKPRQQSFIRVRDGGEPDVQTFLLTLKEDREEIYLVAPALWAALQAEITPHILAVTIDRQNNLSVWPLRIPGSDGRANGWHSSALLAAHAAKRQWIRCQANMIQGQYDIYEAAANLAEPEWPTLTTEEILRIAFRDRYITSPDHPVLRKLRGEV